MSNQAVHPVVSFEYSGNFRKIRVDPCAGLDSLLQLVGGRWKLSVPIDLLYEDPATGRNTILDVDDDLVEVFSQNFKWKVVTNLNVISNSPSASVAVSPRSVTPLQTHVSGQDLDKDSSSDIEDEHDQNVECKKEFWTELIPANWICKSKIQKHPFFISYRHASEAVIAENLFLEIKIALLEDFRGSFLPLESISEGQHAFLDAKCLSFAQKWGINFMSGLFHSAVIILLCSDQCLERMQEADKRPDNVLLEWELALQMKEERGHDILPILLSRSVPATLEDGSKSFVVKPFDSFDHEKFPDKPHKHPLSPGRQTVRDVVKMVLDLNGPKANPETDISKVVTEAREVYNRRRIELQTGNPSPDISLSRSRLFELEEWLAPLTDEMEEERKSLLKNVLQGSRKWLLRKVFQFLSTDDPSAASANRVMWLNGIAGVGKSVMAALVSTKLQSQNLLGGMFFCKHDDERCSSARSLVVTLAYSLAKFSIHFGRILIQVKQEHPDILTRSLFEMMKVLIAKPLANVAANQKLLKPLVLIVDALDECGTLNQRAEVLSVFHEMNRLLPANVKILVTGRPEEDIAQAFETLPVELIEPSVQDNIQDQIDFAQHFLKSMGADPSVVVKGSSILVSKSSGVFVWLVMACACLRNSQSKTIGLAEISALPDTDKLDGRIDALYDRIFAGLCQSAQLRNLQNVMQTVLVVILLSYEPLTASGIVAMLSPAEPDSVLSCIRMMEPILVLDRQTRKLRIFHKSVKDYLVSPERCTQPSLQIDPTTSHAALARWCICALDRSLKFNLCEIPFSDFHSEIPEFLAKVDKNVPEHVAYAVKHFWEHCSESFVRSDSSSHEVLLHAVTHPAHEELDPSRQVLKDLFLQLKTFLFNHGHHYLEASSLLNALDLVIPAMDHLLKIQMKQSVLGQPDARLSSLAVDMKRVVQKFSTPMKASALQVYFTAVPFSPSESEFHKSFSGKVPPGVSPPTLVKGQPATWPPCLNTLEGHTEPVYSAAFSPDGQLLVSGSGDRSVWIWNASSGQELLRLEGHLDCVRSAAFSPNGKLIVTGSDDKSVRIWRASTGQELLKLEGHSKPVLAAAFSLDGKLVVSGGGDDTVRIWEVSTGAQLQEIVANLLSVYAVAFSPDGHLVVSGGADKTVKIWNAQSGELVHQLEGHSLPVNSAAFSPDGRMVVCGSCDRTVRVWNAVTAEPVAAMKGHTDFVTSSGFSPDGQLVVSGSKDKTVRIWSAATGEELLKLEGHFDEVSAAAISPDGRSVASSSKDKTIKLWSILGGQKPHEQEGHTLKILHTSLSSDGKSVISASEDKTVRVWSAFTGQELVRLEGHMRGVSCATFNSDGSAVVSGSWDKTARVWSVPAGQETCRLAGHRYQINSAAFSPDNQFIVTGSDDETVRIWSASTGRELRKLMGHADLVTTVSFSADGQRIVSGSWDKTVRVWSVSSGQQLLKIGGHIETVVSATFSPDGALIASGSWDKTVRIWGALSGDEKYTLEGHQSKIHSVAFSPDGWFVVSTDGSGFAKVWNVESGKELLGDTSSSRNLGKISHQIGVVRNASGDKLHSLSLSPSSVLTQGAWFSHKESRVCFWVPPELRGDWQHFCESSVLFLGEGFSCVARF